jgi:hypothetical protein
LGDYHVRELFLYEKDFGSMAFALVGVGFRSLWLKASMIGEAGPCPF